MSQTTSGISSVSEAFAGFAAYLMHHRAQDIALIAEVRNGFEGWVKLEFYRWLRTQGLGADDVGMEYRLNRGSSGHAEKRCDLWIRAQDAERYHYVELKVPFAFANTRKMLRLGGVDLRHMMSIDAEYECAASGSLILFGNDFTVSEWVSGRRLVIEAAGIDAKSEPTRHDVIGGQLYWDVWTHQYGG